KVARIEVFDAAWPPSLADGVTAALQSMSRASLAPPVGDVDSVAIVLQLVPEESPDTVPALRQIFKAKVPRYGSPFSYASMPASGGNTKYPFGARPAGVAAGVTRACTW